MEGTSNGVLYESEDRKLPLGGWNLPEAAKGGMHYIFLS